jgi:hypothetical protein
MKPTMKTTVTLFAFALLTAACGDDSSSATPDAPKQPADGAPIEVPTAYIVAGDFTTGDPGVMAKIDPALATVTKMVAPAGAVGDDPILRHLGDKLAIINRTDDQVTLLDDTTLALVGQFSTGTGTDPQDAAIVGTTLFAANYLGKGLTAVDMTTSTITQIDLSADDPDGDPNCGSVVAVGNALYVSCSLLDPTNHSAPRGFGKVYVVDATTKVKNAAATITLTTKNPLSLMERSPETGPLLGKLVVSTVEFPPVGTGVGCIEVIPVDGVTTTSSCLVDNATIGGFAGRLDFHGDDHAMTLWYAATTTDFSAQFLSAYDFATQTVFPTVVTPTTQSPNDMVVCPGDHYVYADETMTTGGVRVRGPNSEATAAAALDIGLSPQSSHGLVCF